MRRMVPPTLQDRLRGFRQELRRLHWNKVKLGVLEGKTERKNFLRFYEWYMNIFFVMTSGWSLFLLSFAV